MTRTGYDRRFASRVPFALLLAAALASCGQNPTDAELAAQQQQALAATVSAGAALAATDAPPRAVTAAPSLRLPTTAATTAPMAHATATARAVPSAVPPPPARAVAKQAAPTALTLTPPPAPPTHVPAPTVPPAPPAPIVPPTSMPATAVPTVPPTAPPDDGAVTTLAFRDLYSGAVITGPVLSDKANKLNGRKVVMNGYMAPPLKPDLDFFVLTKDPMVYCPFCNSAADWPFDIVFIRMANGTVPALVPTQSIRVTGTFSVGTATDAATGFVSQVRIIADKVDVTQ